MKNQLIATIAAIGTWLLIQSVWYIFFGYRMLGLGITENGIAASCLGGIFGALVYIKISKTEKIHILALPICIILASWGIAFPTPEWKNPFLWNGLMYGPLVMLAIAFTSKINRTHKLQ